jgi:hypothetical protein
MKKFLWFALIFVFLLGCGLGQPVANVGTAVAQTMEARDNLATVVAKTLTAIPLNASGDQTTDTPQAEQQAPTWTPSPTLIIITKTPTLTPTTTPTKTPTPSKTNDPCSMTDAQNIPIDNHTADVIYSYDIDSCHFVLDRPIEKNRDDWAKIPYGTFVLKFYDHDGNLLWQSSDDSTSGLTIVDEDDKTYGIDLRAPICQAYNVTGEVTLVNHFGEDIEQLYVEDDCGYYLYNVLPDIFRQGQSVTVRLPAGNRHYYIVSAEATGGSWLSPVEYDFGEHFDGFFDVHWVPEP